MKKPMIEVEAQWVWKWTWPRIVLAWMVYGALIVLTGWPIMRMTTSVVSLILMIWWIILLLAGGSWLTFKSIDHIKL